VSCTFSQIGAVAAMGLRSIRERVWMSLSTVLAVALVTCVLLAFLSMANGLRRTVSGTGSADVAIFLRKGSSGEINSTITREQVSIIQGMNAIARNAEGAALLSAETYIVVDGVKRSSGTKANLPLRGVGPQAIEVRRGVRISRGRMVRTGMPELVVGRGVAKQFTGFEFGRIIPIAGQLWTVVGEIEAGGSVLESEIWTDAAMLQTLQRQGSNVQTVRARMSGAGAFETLKAQAELDPRLNLDVRKEAEFYAAQSGGMSDMILYVGWPLAIAMSLGALAGALNTMYSSVEARMREIATLRAIGFSGAAAFIGTLTESLLLSLIGGVVGAVGAFLLFDGVSAATLGRNFSQVVFSLQLSPGLVLQGVVLALAIGFAGGVFPAWRAARMPLLAAFREH
jgi:putative ABC transport system permease protein